MISKGPHAWKGTGLILIQDVLEEEVAGPNFIDRNILSFLPVCFLV